MLRTPDGGKNRRVKAVEVIRERAIRARPEAEARWTAALRGRVDPSLEEIAPKFTTAGRLTLNFHPDRLAASGLTVVAGLLADGRYRSQWVTGISNGSRSAIPGGDRHRFERELFADVYEAVDSAAVEFPIYGAFDLLQDTHGGSPRFGSSFVVLRPHVLERTTMCVGDSHVGPSDVGLADAPWSLLAGLAEQAAAGVMLDRPIDTDALVALLNGGSSEPSARRSLDGYVEAQVHGGVDLTADVEAIVCDPSFRDTDIERDLQAIGDRFGIEIRWHRGSELDVGAVPSDFRGPDMPELARRAAGASGVLDAAAIGRAAASVVRTEPRLDGDPPESAQQQWKFLWHTLFARGHDAGDAHGRP